MNAQELMKQNEKMRADRANFDSAWQEIADYMVPHRRNITGEVTQGVKQTTMIHDSTAIEASTDLSAWLHSSLTSMSMDWFSLKFGGDIDDKEGQVWLDVCKKLLYNALRASNFEMEINSLYLDLVNFCTSGLYSGEIKQTKKGWFPGFQFTCLVPGKFAISEGEGGVIDALFREFQLKASDAVLKWPGRVSEKIASTAQREPLKPFNFIHAVYPAAWEGKEKEKKFASAYVDVEGKKIITKGGYYEFPFHVPRWMKASGEMYGRGPGFTALPDVKTLNTGKKLAIKAWAKTIDPPLTQIKNGVVGIIDSRASGITTITQAGVVMPLTTGIDWKANQINVEDLRRSVRSIFKADQIRMLPPPDEKRQMTAYEVSVLYETAQKLLGSTFGNITHDLLDPLIERCFNMMFRANAFPPPPQSVVEILQNDEDRVNIEYEGPLARAQRAQFIEAVNKTMILIKPMAEVAPQVLDNFDFDEIARETGKVSGIPAKMFTDKKKMDKERDLQNQIKALQVQLEQAELAAGAAQKGAAAAKSVGETDQATKTGLAAALGMGGQA